MTIENIPAIDAMRFYDPTETLHYVDLPYVLSTRKAKGYRHEMSDGDHWELAAALHALKGPVLISGYDCPLYEELFEGWTRLERKNLNTALQVCTESL